MADILVVDDDTDLRELLAEFLEAEGHRVRQAHNGLEGLELLAQCLPDLTLLDVEMPELTGPEMAYLMFLRDHGQERIPVVLVSGVVNLAAVAVRVGTPYFLAKPFDLDRLLKLVHLALEQHLPPRPGAQP